MAVGTSTGYQAQGSHTLSGVSSFFVVLSGTVCSVPRAGFPGQGQVNPQCREQGVLIPARRHLHEATAPSGGLNDQPASERPHHGGPCVGLG